MLINWTKKSSTSNSNPLPIFCRVYLLLANLPSSFNSHMIPGLLHLADHLLGTLAGLSSTRVSRRKCWKQSHWIHGKLVNFRHMKQEYKWCWNESFGGKAQNSDCLKRSWWSKIVQSFKYFEDCPCWCSCFFLYGNQSGIQNLQNTVRWTSTTHQRFNYLNSQLPVVRPSGCPHHPGWHWWEASLFGCPSQSLRSP